MGASIATFFTLSGFPVVLLEISEDALAIGMDRINKNLQQSAKRGILDESALKTTLALIRTSTQYEDLADSDLVIEAVFERLDIKQRIFKRLDSICKPGAILATNTSYLDINLIADATSRPESVVGLHFFSPAHIMKLVEIVRTDRVRPEIIAMLMSMIKSLGKTCVIAGVCHGFIGNRIYQRYQCEVGLLMLEGATPTQIDTALYNFGMAMGPLSVLDLSGLDISYMMRKSLPEGQVHPHAFQIHDKLVELNRKGRKTNAGFYDYENGKQQVSKQVIEIIQATAKSLGYQQSQIPEEKIVRRCMNALAVEGNNILQERIADVRQ